GSRYRREGCQGPARSCRRKRRVPPPAMRRARPRQLSNRTVRSSSSAPMGSEPGGFDRPLLGPESPDLPRAPARGASSLAPPRSSLLVIVMYRQSLKLFEWDFPEGHAGHAPASLREREGLARRAHTSSSS